MSDELVRIPNHPVFGFLLVEDDVGISRRKDMPADARIVSPTDDIAGPDEAVFYQSPRLYPVTIVQPRYGGFYEGGQWLAFPCYPHQLSLLCPSWADSDIECTQFWNEVNADPDKWPIGRGKTPDEAYKNVINQIIELAKKENSHGSTPSSSQ